MHAMGVSTEEFLHYHISQMELHRYLLTIDQSSTRGKYVRHWPSTKVLPVPLHPERGVVCICDVRGSTFSSFYEAWGELQEMIAIDKPNYYNSMDKMLILNADYAFSHIVWPMLEPLLSKDVTDKVKVVAGDPYQGLLEHIDHDNIPGGFLPGEAPRPPEQQTSFVFTASRRAESFSVPLLPTAVIDEKEQLVSQPWWQFCIPCY